MIKNVCWSSCKISIILVRFFTKSELSGQMFEKYSNIKFHENISRRSRVVPWDRRVDRHDEANT